MYKKKSKKMIRKKEKLEIFVDSSEKANCNRKSTRNKIQKTIARKHISL